MQVAIDLSPIINQVIVPLLTPLLLAAGAWALNRVAAYAKFQVQDGQRAMLEKAIRNGIAYAEKQASGIASISADEKVAAAANYVLPKIPGALKGLGVTPEHLASLIKARL